MDKSNLGNRMKGYENVTRHYLIKRMPVIIRLDGKAFHTFTKGMKRPFDDILVKTMQHTMKYLCENIQGCVLGYTQSDEITLVLVNYKQLNSCPWFDNNIQKIVSISASMATMAFNTFYRKNIEEYKYNNGKYLDKTIPKELEKYNMISVYWSKLNRAMFDSRVFNIPKEEVCNCLIWRQQDATRNSIQSVGQANFSRKQLHKKSCDQVQEILMTNKNINWNDLPVYLKRGSCCVKSANKGTGRSEWVIDEEIPIFTQNREYIENRAYI
jgi:tRNA(His) 5'-end guanylyltransferase